LYDHQIRERASDGLNLPDKFEDWNRRENERAVGFRKRANSETIVIWETLGCAQLEQWLKHAGLPNVAIHRSQCAFAKFYGHGQLAFSDPLKAAGCHVLTPQIEAGPGLKAKVDIDIFQ
jgi:hypothetical protein